MTLCSSFTFVVALCGGLCILFFLIGLITDQAT